MQSISLAPRHDRYGRQRILWGAFDDLVAERDVDERVALLVDDPKHVGVLEKDRGPLGVYQLLVGQLRDIGGDRPIWRQAIEKREGSSARPSPPLMPPVRAWLTWHATPGTFGSSNALMQTLSFGPRKGNVVLRQARSSACAAAAAPSRPTTTSITESSLDTVSSDHCPAKRQIRGPNCAGPCPTIGYSQTRRGVEIKHVSPQIG